MADLTEQERKQLPHPFELSDHEIVIANVTITTHKGPIVSAKDDEKWRQLLDGHCPEMVFASNMLRISHQLANGSTATIEFNAYDALKLCEIDPDDPEQLAAIPTVSPKLLDAWKQRAAARPDLLKIIIRHDWTYSTTYEATLSGFDRAFELTETDAFDVALLTRHDPILMFDDIVLYEDELHDSGDSRLTVKMRVMPTFYLVLCRFFLRLDGNLVKLREIRYFHLFGSDVVLKQVQEKSATAKDAAARDKKGDSPCFFGSPDEVSQWCPITSSTMYKCVL